MLAAYFGIHAPPAEVGDIFLPRYIFFYFELKLC